MEKGRKRYWLKRLVAVVLSLCMAVGAVSLAGPVEVQAAGDPDFYCGAYDSSRNPFAMSNWYGQCTWYAWGRAYEVTGKSLPCRGNANSWYDVARDNGWSVGSAPAENAIAVWSKGAVGHVAYVESVDGDWVTISESNVNPWTLDHKYSLEEGMYYYYGKNPYSSAQMRSLHGNLIGYIYLGSSSASATPCGSLMGTGGSRTIPDGDYQIVTALDKNMCLTIDSWSLNDGANAQLYHSVGDKDQVFNVTWLGEGKGYKITYKKSGKALTVDGEDKRFSGLNVDQWNWYENSGQMWVINEVDGGYTIQARSSGYYLDVDNGNTADGTNIRMWRGNDSMAQRWYFVPWGGGSSAKQEIQNGEYYIVPQPATNMTLNAKGDGTTDETNIILWPSLQDRRHTFHVNWLGNGYYELINSNSNLDLDVSGGLSKKGANVQLYRRLDENNKKWLIQPCGDGSYHIISKCNGLYLDLYGGNTAMGTNVHLWVGHGTPTQKWLFIPYTEKVDAKSVRLNKSSLTLETGEQSTLTATVSPTDASDQTLTWKSSNPAVAAVDGSGVVTAKSAGTATVTVKTANGKTAVCSVVVKKQTGGSKDEGKTDCSHVYRKTIVPATIDEDGSIVEECRKCGYEKISTTIPAIDTVILSKTRFVYNGREQEPEVTVEDNEGRTLVEGEDYTVSVDGNAKKVGRYTVVVEFEGNYEGEVERTFDIIPKGTVITELTAKDHGFSISWRKRTSQTTGYEIAYSTSPRFTKTSTETVQVKKNRITAQSVWKLNSGKKYYVRIRTYKTIKFDGETIKIYSGWSEKRAVVVKK